MTLKTACTSNETLDLFHIVPGVQITAVNTTLSGMLVESHRHNIIQLIQNMHIIPL